MQCHWSLWAIFNASPGLEHHRCYFYVSFQHNSHRSLPSTVFFSKISNFSMYCIICRAYYYPSWYYFLFLHFYIPSNASHSSYSLYLSFFLFFYLFLFLYGLILCWRWATRTTRDTVWSNCFALSARMSTAVHQIKDVRTHVSAAALLYFCFYFCTLCTCWWWRTWHTDSFLTCNAIFQCYFDDKHKCIMLIIWNLRTFVSSIYYISFILLFFFSSLLHLHLFLHLIYLHILLLTFPQLTSTTYISPHVLN